jgi:hypothetical protein
VRIFLSYRREDSSAWAGRLHDTLAARFGEQNIFQDVAAIRAGEDFDDAIDRALAQADVTLVVIGPQWLAATAPGGETRLAQEGDYVRAELTAAFTHGSRVVPLLLGGGAPACPPRPSSPTAWNRWRRGRRWSWATPPGTRMSMASSARCRGSRRQGAGAGHDGSCLPA